MENCDLGTKANFCDQEKEIEGLIRPYQKVEYCGEKTNFLKLKENDSLLLWRTLIKCVLKVVFSFILQFHMACLNNFKR